MANFALKLIMMMINLILLVLMIAKELMARIAIFIITIFRFIIVIIGVIINMTIIKIMIRMATEGMAIMSEAMEPGQGPQLGHRLPQVDHHDDHDE